MDGEEIWNEAAAEVRQISWQILDRAMVWERGGAAAQAYSGPGPTAPNPPDRRR